jgi:hypothetical protein
MQQSRHFDTLLSDTVNLPQWRLDQLDDRVNSIYAAIKRDTVLGDLVTGKSKQGSWAHKMIIKPKPGKEYDADVLIHMTENTDWDDDKGQYIEQLYWALGRVGYSGKATRKTRCVRVQYANECHVDLVPYVSTAFGSRIVNKATGEWEYSNPEGFTSWMAERDTITNGNFRRAVRLMKYLRDHKNSFTGTRSIILTTLLGNQANYSTALYDPDAYRSVPNTLVTLVEELDTWMQARPTMPDVCDPSWPTTTFNHRWSQGSYSYFRERINAHAAQMRSALDETNAAESERKWQALFGDGFRRDDTASSSTNPFAGVAVAGVATSSGRTGRAG